MGNGYFHICLPGIGANLPTELLELKVRLFNFAAGYRQASFPFSSKLKRLLNETHDSDLVVLATWNDLGEGTGINRCYDYYWGDQWQRPTHFMELIRASQEGNLLTVETRK